MKTINQIRLAVLAIVCLAMLAATPWALYYCGLRELGGTPDLAAAPIDRIQQQALWAAAGCVGEPVLEVLDPFSYLLAAATLDAPPPSSIFAWRVASAYQHGQLQHSGMLWRQLSSTALTIWITRHWTMEQILSKVAQADQARQHYSGKR